LFKLIVVEHLPDFVGGWDVFQNIFTHTRVRTIPFSGRRVWVSKTVFKGTPQNNIYFPPCGEMV
jgi:hypothetical protein